MCALKGADDFSKINLIIEKKNVLRVCLVGGRSHVREIFVRASGLFVAFAHTQPLHNFREHLSRITIKTGDAQTQSLVKDISRIFFVLDTFIKVHLHRMSEDG